jgi:assimilatory nitrate reductase catalytic subunit
MNHVTVARRAFPLPVVVDTAVDTAVDTTVVTAADTVTDNNQPQPALVATRTTCPYCGVGCGVNASVRDGRVEIAGDAAHPANRGRLCVKGSALGETVDLDGRLLTPRIRQDDRDPTRDRTLGPAAAWREASWDEALARVADGFKRVMAEHGPDAVAFYVSGQFLTEDYYVANKLMKGYIGSANIDTNSRLCMSSAVAGHKRAFGADLVPLCYDDLELADLVVLVGSNAAWCHPILFQRIVRARALRPEMKLVVLDPRRTATCELADLHVPLKPGTDVWLFNGLLAYLARQGMTDTAFVDAHAAGAAEALAAAVADAGDPGAVAARCGLGVDVLLAFYALFAATGKTVTAFSQGVNQSSAGTDKVNSIINCHLLTGRIGKPGMGPFSLTGQPNAMGGREVGGLSTMLAAHLELGEPAHRALVQEFWRAPTMAQGPGLKAVELFEAIEAGRVKAVWIMATNPLVSLPDSEQARRALAACELVVVSDVVAATDTSAYAHVLLPALAWGEKDGTVTNSERRISRQRAFLPAPGLARADWDILCDVARRMGYAGFEFDSAHAVFDEHARLSAYRNIGVACGDDVDAAERAAGEIGVAPPIARMFDIGGLAGLTRAEYDAMEPVQWPLRTKGLGTNSARLFADGRYAHADGRARLVPTPARAPAHACDDAYPLVLNTGRVRDQWHTMTRTGKSARLAEHTAEPTVDLHPQDALRHGLREGALARVASRWGSLVARVQHSGGIARGQVFVPIHWSGQTASDACAGALVNPVVDPLSGEPEFKHTPVRVEPFEVEWYGFALVRGAQAPPPVAHWTRVTGRAHTRYQMAGRTPFSTCAEWIRAWLALAPDDADCLEYADAGAGVYRYARVVDDRLDACVFISTRPDLPPQHWLAGLFALDALDAAARAGLLAGRALAAGADTGPLVCACFGVGRDTICAAIAEYDLRTPAAITACVQAGGNCGSCVPELKKLLALAPRAPIADAAAVSDT